MTRHSNLLAPLDGAFTLAWKLCNISEMPFFFPPLSRLSSRCWVIKMQSKVLQFEPNYNGSIKVAAAVLVGNQQTENGFTAMTRHNVVGFPRNIFNFVSKIECHWKKATESGEKENCGFSASCSRFVSPFSSFFFAMFIINIFLCT